MSSTFIGELRSWFVVAILKIKEMAGMSEFNPLI